MMAMRVEQGSKTLCELSSAAAAQVIQKHYNHQFNDFCVNQNMTFSLGMKLKGIDLVEFISKQFDTSNFRKKWTSDKFQEFLFHVIREWESASFDENNFIDGARRKNTALHLKNFLANVNFAANNVIDEKTGRSESRYMCEKTSDWVLQSLGCNQLFSMDRFYMDEKDKFFRIKFLQENISFFHSAEISTTLLSFISTPEDNLYENKFHHHSIHVPSPNFILACKANKTRKRILREELYDFNENDKFIDKISAMTKSLQCQRHHYVIIYALDLISRSISNQKKWDDDCNSYFLHVWGMLSVSLASIWADPKIIVYCLNQMKFFSQIFSEKLDAWMYEIEVYNQLGWLEQEHNLFFQVWPLLPQSSFFFEKCWKIHFWGHVKVVENYIFYIFIINKVWKDENAETLENLKVEIVEKSEHILQYLKRFLTHIISKNAILSPYKEEEILACVQIVHLYQSACDQLKFPISYEYRYNRTTIAYNLKDYNCHYSCYLNIYLKDDYEEQNYSEKIQQQIHRLNKNSLTSQSIFSADLLFSHIVLLKTFEPDFNNICDEFFKNCLEIYTIQGHFRSTLCYAFENACAGDTLQNVVCENVFSSNFVNNFVSIENHIEILFQEKKMKEMAIAGFYSSLYKNLQRKC